ncbi:MULTISPECIES: acyl-CoA dehydrogenase family protein [unclassified Curtobacterium]|jgi:glutaryl-CoA dehydrogenase|uniref:acyl-CoA dehydrogenase family protein n=1 Tax=unclassified Curtobacterium TaxID=257496 RepID=UPI000832D573|nr:MULTISPECIES: acyl-CoA dehydrogenase family protein [unclassified Curtobacterium]MBP1300739.1 glutaryl-CoA dehydrogenase [Curtobacterium sp. 1310]MCM3504930.1 acyl-CoA dehydrogenase family protein [Curtobacterium sp. ODYSSEY 48 V2]MCM3521445.1 acyl-CoA dehydrogenase family protein [Curtobacterium sp. P97]MDB6427349.1 acyl-CoA dehydrogenase family protein [Curtobacterium sp. 20TX0008]MDT0209062.1 acyl-CoA dehydrogenase family protein [Curtobacterium sp. BRD11]
MSTSITDTPLLESDFYRFQEGLTARERESLGQLRAYLEAEVRPIADQYWARAEFPVQTIAPLAELGMYGPGIPLVRHFENSAVYRGWAALELGRIDAGVSTFIGVQSGLAMNSIAVGGSDEQQQEWLPRMARGEVVGAFGLTEPLSGSDSARGLRTTARREGDTWVLDGEKRWIGNATFADVVVIWAKDVADQQVKGFLVTTDTPGFTATKIEDKIALRTVQNADIVLDGVRVPESRRLQRADSFRTTAAVLRLTRTEVAWQAVGIAIGAYEAALAYARERVQFGKPIAAHQMVQDLLVRSLMNITASIALCTQASAMQDQGIGGDEHSAMAKAFATAKMRETVGWCREVQGGNGIVLDKGVARFFSDAEAIYSYEGTREVNTLIVGRAITGEAAFV